MMEMKDFLYLEQDVAWPDGKHFGLCGSPIQSLSQLLGSAFVVWEPL